MEDYSAKCKNCGGSIYRCPCAIDDCAFKWWVHHGSYSHMCRHGGTQAEPGGTQAQPEPAAAQAAAQELMAELAGFNPDDDRWSATDLFEIVVLWAGRHGVDADGAALKASQDVTPERHEFLVTVDVTGHPSAEEMTAQVKGALDLHFTGMLFGDNDQYDPVQWS